MVLITRDLLRSLRNDLPMAFTLRQLGERGPYSKTMEGRLLFQCIHCHETRAAINPRNNLAHCFACHKNINNIDLLIHAGLLFPDAVRTLQEWLRQYHAESSHAIHANPSASVRNAEPTRLIDIFAELGKRPPKSNQ